MTSVIISYPFTVNLLPSVIDNNISNLILDTSNLYNHYIKDNGLGNALNAYPSTNSTTSMNTLSYFSISFSTNSNYFCDIHSISFEVGKGGNSDPRGYKIYSNQDNYIVPIANVQLPTGSKQSPNPTTFNLSFNKITEFNLRIYVYAPQIINSIDFRYFTINGIVYDTQPTLISVFPALNATDISINTNLVFTFSENVVNTTGNIYLYDASTNDLLNTFDVTGPNVSISGSQVTLNPTIDLSFNRSLYVNIDSGAFEDAAGNIYTGLDSSSGDVGMRFTTELDVTQTRLFDIIKFCQDKKCQQNIQYNRLKTGGNDPSMSAAMRYAQYVRGAKPRPTQSM